MVRRSSLVYELLKSERRDDGFTPKEIIERVSQTYDITAGKGLRKQVTVALRRGIDFGIIARKNNKYRFDPGTSSAIEAWSPKKGNALTNAATGKTSKAKKNRRSTRVKTKPRGYSTWKKDKSGSKKQQKRTRPSTQRPAEPLPPRPTVPKPPNWNQKRRNLSEEPIPKVIKHSNNDEDSS